MNGPLLEDDFYCWSYKAGSGTALFCESQDYDFQNLIFNESNVESCSFQKHLGLTLDEILNFDEFVQYKIIKCNKLIGIAKRLSLNLPHEAFLTS